MSWLKMAVSVLTCLSVGQNVFALQADQLTNKVVTNHFYKESIQKQNQIRDNTTILLFNFFKNLSITDIYRMHQIFKDSTSVISNSSNFLDLLKTRTDHQLSTLLARSHSFDKNPNTTEPQEYEHIINVYNEWQLNTTSAGAISNLMLFTEADKIFNELSADEAFGHIYEISYHPRIPRFFWSRAIYLEQEQENTIEKTLEMTALSENDLTNEWALDLFSTNDLTESELRELKGLSAASAEFENLTFLRGDMGGWKGNFLGSFQKSPEQSLCHEKAITSARFLRDLALKKALKSFTPAGTILRFNHEAALLQSIRTKKYFVFDTWFDDGGSSARLYSEQDWILRKDGRFFRAN